MTRLKVLLAVLALPVAGCANIPEQSNPQAVGSAEQTANNPVDQPTVDADPLTVVREFIGHLGDAEAARGYLTDDAKRSWQPDPNPMIIDHTFNTRSPSVREPDATGNEQTVLLSAHEVGRLGADNSFYPGTGNYTDKVVLRKQADGQWRIAAPPAVTAVTIDEFQSAYQPVQLFFFDPELNVLVPDQRYVVRQPLEGLPSRVLQLLLAGPSGMLNGPLRSLLGDRTNTRTNVIADPSGALVVNLTDLGDQPLDTRNKIAAQIVRSLQPVATGFIRLLSDGAPLVPGHDRWSSSDVPFYAGSSPSPSLSGMFVSAGRLRSLDGGGFIPGPAGAGAYPVLSAAQSINGSELAVVERRGAEVRLRVGKTGGLLDAVSLPARTMTRPSWQPSRSRAEASNEVWTVVDGGTIVRVLRTKDGTWAPSTVNATALAPFGTITDLRLARDGTRVAMVANGHVVVAGVQRSPDAATIRLPRVLRQNTLTSVVGVDWIDPEMLVAATSGATDAVVSLPFDGLVQNSYDMSNLNPPLRSVAAAPGLPVIVTDDVGMWTSGGLSEVWRPLSQNVGPASAPFYPG